MVKALKRLLTTSFYCPFARSFWHCFGLNIPLDDVSPGLVVETFRDQLGLPFFMKIVILISWSIWITQNDFIFRNVQPTQQHAFFIFKKEFALVILRAKSPNIVEQMDRHPLVTSLFFVSCFFLVSFWILFCFFSILIYNQGCKPLLFPQEKVTIHDFL